jgi:hypothetical protein
MVTGRPRGAARVAGLLRRQNPFRRPATKWDERLRGPNWSEYRSQPERQLLAACHDRHRHTHRRGNERGNERRTHRARDYGNAQRHTQPGCAERHAITNQCADDQPANRGPDNKRRAPE